MYQISSSVGLYLLNRHYLFIEFTSLL